MSDVKEMFLKAADFQLIQKLIGQLYQLGYVIQVRGKKYGSYILSINSFTEDEILEARELFAEEALDIILGRDGVHA